MTEEEQEEQLREQLSRLGEEVLDRRLQER